MKQQLIELNNILTERPFIKRVLENCLQFSTKIESKQPKK